MSPRRRAQVVLSHAQADIYTEGVTPPPVAICTSISSMSCEMRLPYARYEAGWSLPAACWVPPIGYNTLRSKPAGRPPLPPHQVCLRNVNRHRGCHCWRHADVHGRRRSVRAPTWDGPQYHVRADPGHAHAPRHRDGNRRLRFRFPRADPSRGPGHARDYRTRTFPIPPGNPGSAMLPTIYRDNPCRSSIAYSACRPFRAVPE